MHAFKREETEVVYLGKLIIRDTFQASDRGNNPINVVYIDPIGLVILSALSSIYSVRDGQIMKCTLTSSRVHTVFEGL